MRAREPHLRTHKFTATCKQITAVHVALDNATVASATVRLFGVGNAILALKHRPKTQRSQRVSALVSQSV